MAESERSRAVHLQLLAVSWNFGWPIAAGVIVGYWIDEKVGTSPAATLLIGIGAMAASTWRLLRLSREEQKARDAEEASRPPASEPVSTGPRVHQEWDDETEQWIDVPDDDDTPENTR